VSLNRQNLRDRVSFYLGYGTAYSDLNLSRRQDVDIVVEDGLDQFYKAHKWYFMRPVMTLEATAEDVDLPAGIASIDGNITLTGDDGVYDFAVIPTGIGEILRLRERHGYLTSRPERYALHPVVDTDGITSVMRVSLWPKPNATVTLQFRAMLHFEPNTGSELLGASQHRDTLIESCLAVAEARRDDVLGIHNQLYREKLDASIRRDADLHAGNNLGKMLEESDLLNGRPAEIRRPGSAGVIINP
jgi:hypothetical protein